MTILSCNNLSFSYGDINILNNVSFSIEKESKAAIIGSNGCGKSTLLKLINGIETPDDGNIFISKNTTIGYLPQHVEIDSQKSILKEITDGYSDIIKIEKEIEALRSNIEKGNTDLIDNYNILLNKLIDSGGLEYQNRAKSLLNSLGFKNEDFNTSVSNLSGGERTRLYLAKILLNNPDLLILDEPTNHLDLNSIQWLESLLKKSKQTIIIVSHDRYFLNQISDITFEISNHNITKFNGNYDYYSVEKQRLYNIQLHNYFNQQKEITRINNYIMQQKAWNRERNIRAAESRQKMLEKMDIIDEPYKDTSKIKFIFNNSSESGNDVLSVINLNKKIGDKIVINNLSFQVKKRDRLLIIGKNGAGKSTLLKIINGIIKQTSGDFFFGYNTKIGYYDQENQQLDDNNTVIEELWSTFPRLPLYDIRKTLSYFLFNDEDIEKRVADLSGGEKARLTFSKLILSDINVLILDEPTNHLDMRSKDILEEALLSFNGTIIAVSHDRYFINKVATRIISFNDNQYFDFKGNYQEYLDYLNSNSIDHSNDYNSKINIQHKQYKDKNNRTNSYKINKLKEQYSSLVNKIESNNKLINNNSSDYNLLQELYNQNASLEEELLVCMEEMEKQNIDY